ncbi:MAG: sensor histidine kinase [Lachnospiraceae bacterium]|nr:sensor histidine kinase [Lachnospiraceae bacterium]
MRNEMNRREAKKVKSSRISAGLRLVMAGVFAVFGIAFAVSLLALAEKNQKDYEQREAETIINGVKESIIANMDNYKALTRIIMMDEDVLKYQRYKNVNPGMTNDAHFGVQRVLNVSTEVDSVLLIRNDGTYMNTGHGGYEVDINRIQDWSWRHVYINSMGKAFVAMNGNDTIKKADGQQMATIIRPTYDLYTLRQTGLLMMNISIEAMLDRILLTQQHDSLCILSNEGSYLAGNSSIADYFGVQFLNADIVREEIKDKTEFRTVSGMLMKDMPFVIMCGTGEGNVSIPTETLTIYAMLLVAFIASVIIASIYITNSITRPISNMVEAMERTKNSGWVKTLDAEVKPNEIGMLKDSFNTVIERQNDLFDSLMEQEKAAQKAEMLVLHEQIKPHFLYNSLETINFMALEAGAEEVSLAVETLGSFYRNFLSKGSREIELKREISIIQDYLKLQKLRYGDIISDEYNIEENTKNFLLPKLTLQPLVENCIYHGIRLKGEPGVIRISSKMIDDKLHLTVYDTGVGMSPEVLEGLLAELQGKKAKFDNGLPKSFGLRGTVERLRYYYNGDDLVTIRSVEGEYTEIELVIPRINIEGEGDEDVQSNAN